VKTVTCSLSQRCMCVWVATPGDCLTSHTRPPAEGRAERVEVKHISAHRSDPRALTSISISLPRVTPGTPALLQNWLCLFAKCSDVRRWTGDVFKTHTFKKVPGLLLVHAKITHSLNAKKMQMFESPKIYLIFINLQI